ncbi:MAG: acetylxylan esterase [Oscillospiraceae bacterium]|nr:acetylxylan esterase [Oscillospiraceae bacterium]
MPMIDMPLAELKRYQGINPKPDDFDAYWARGLAEMHALGTDCELIPSAFQTPEVQCDDLYFTGVGGARVYAKLCRPRGRENCPAILMFHGYSGSSGDWWDKMGVAANGYVVAALDCRGQGGLSEDVGGVKGRTQNGMLVRGIDDPNPDKLLTRQVFLDTAQLARIVMALPEVDATRVGAMGGSQGGGLTLACGALEPAVRKLAALYPFMSDYRRVWEMDLTVNAYQEIREQLRFFDPMHEREDEFFTKMGYIDIQHLMPRIRGDVLLFTGLMDTICPPSTQFAAYNKITAPKDMVIYPDFGHEHLPWALDKAFQHMLGL